MTTEAPMGLHAATPCAECGDDLTKPCAACGREYLCGGAPASGCGRYWRKSTIRYVEGSKCPLCSGEQVDLSPDAYKGALDLLIGVGRTIQLIPLATLDRMLSRFETIAPMLDPTGWIHQGHNIEDARSLVHGAQAFMRHVAEIKERARRRGVKV